MSATPVGGRDAGARAASSPGDAAPGPGESVRERKKRETRQAIHRAVTALAAERDLVDVTVDEICRAAGVSSRTFFNYYPSKAAAVLGSPAATLEEVLAARPALDPRLPLVERAVVLVAAVVEAGAPPERLRELVRREPELVQGALAWAADLRRTLTEHLAPGEPSGRARLAVALVVAALVEHVRAERDPAEPLEDGLRNAVRTLGALAAELGVAGD